MFYLQKEYKDSLNILHRIELICCFVANLNKNVRIREIEEENVSHKHLSERPGQEDEITRTPKKKGGSIIENISLLIMMIIVTYLIGSQITFKITTKTGGWHEYIILLVLGIFSVIVNIALVKKFLILFFVRR